MKNFSVTIDLGKFDCCALRIGHAEVRFHFRILHKKRAIEVSTTKDYHYKWVVDKLFSEEQRDTLREQAQNALTIMQQQLLANDDKVSDLAPGEELVVDKPELES
jgi:hypothetical protein